jgi:stearoyl-CoA desaturase (delta-9 desaturase)
VKGTVTHDRTDDLRADADGTGARRDAGETRLPLRVRVVLPLPGRPTVQFNHARLLARTTVAILLGGALAALWWIAVHGIGLLEVVLFVAMYLVNGLGITVGYHRLFTHLAFRATPLCRAVLGIAGATGMQGPILYWASIHRKHHRFPDAPEDPHSPQPRGSSIAARAAGFYRGFVGWMLGQSFALYPDYVKDLRRDPVALWVDRYYPVWIALGFVVPGLAGAAWYGTWEGYWAGLLIGGPLRAFCTFSASGLVNSLAHLHGRQNFRSGDDSRNNAFVAVVALGEGLHNNHHAFPYAARFSLRPGEVDIGYPLVRLLERIGSAQDVKLAPPGAAAAPEATSG